jgi:SAM-dependent methyltransferase
LIQEGKKVNSNDKLYFDGEVEIEIGKLVSYNKERNKEEFIKRNLDMFNKSIKETPHYTLLRDYIEDPQLNLAETKRCKISELWLSFYGTPFTDHNGITWHTGIQRTQSFIDLYEKIRSGNAIEPIRVKVLSDGHFEVTDGLHRAAIALALGHQSITATLSSVDDDVHLLLKRLLQSYPSGEKSLYSSIDHVIFTDWKILRDDTRHSLIAETFEHGSESVLDIGSYTGNISRFMECKGTRVTGIDTDYGKIKIAKQLNKLLGTTVDYIHGDFNDYLIDKKFDCIVFFSVLHWILKDDGLEGVKKSLRLIAQASPIMFFDMGQHQQKAAVSTEKLWDSQWSKGLQINKDTIPDLVMNNCNYNRCEYLGQGNLGRYIFKFWRDE